MDSAAVEEAWPALPTASVLLSLLEIPLGAVVAAVRLAAETGTRPVVTLAPVQPVPAELLSQIVDAVGAQVPVVAAGGIFDGRGLAAALALGADGVWIGTRFIATPEARSVSGYKDALISSREDGTTISRAYSGKTMRVVRNQYTQYFDEHPTELAAFPQQLGRSIQDGAFHLGADIEATGVDPDRECFPAGQGTGAISELVPAGELVHRIVAEAEDVLSRGRCRLAAIVDRQARLIAHGLSFASSQRLA